MTDARSFVIVGAGQAGRWLALTLRAQGFAGRIVWLGEEAHPPYDRPPLSKAVLKGDVPLAQLALIPADKFAALQVDWRPGQTVTAIHRDAKEIVTSGGERLHYDTLFLAHGGRARRLPGVPAHPRVLTLRSYEDAMLIKQQILAAQRVLVLGGGWIGLEVAASARLLGKPVTLLEAAPRLCVRTVPPCVSAHLLALHQAQGVDVRSGDGVQAVEVSDAGVVVRLASGTSVQGDCLVVGIGLVANDDIAAAAGLEVGNGVLTDASGRTSDAAIFAVGDLANAMRAGGADSSGSGNLEPGTRLRIESWDNAQRQAIAAAKAALGIEHDHQADGPPWFWSDQYDDNLQLLGLPDESMQVIERAVPEKRQRVFFFCTGKAVRAVAAVNAGREVKIARKWISQGRYPALASLADPGVDLNKLPLE
jgi:3-phenylpropionate/trans-cinnamate dioxygenase ferredoxin reductase component